MIKNIPELLTVRLESFSDTTLESSSFSDFVEVFLENY